MTDGTTPQFSNLVRRQLSDTFGYRLVGRGGSNGHQDLMT